MNFMSPEDLSGRKSRQWQYLGFQGNDPATDFRASGELGLNFILYVIYIITFNVQMEIIDFPLNKFYVT